MTLTVDRVKYVGVSRVNSTVVPRGAAWIALVQNEDTVDTWWVALNGKDVLEEYYRTEETWVDYATARFIVL